MGRAGRTLVLLGAAAASSCTILAGVFAVAFVNEQTPPTVLTRGLPGNRGNITPAFDRRVREWFPLGSTDAAMGATLARNGFVREDGSSGSNRPHRATRRESGICRRDFTVSWTVDAAGRSTKIDGSASASCL